MYKAEMLIVLEKIHISELFIIISLWFWADSRAVITWNSQIQRNKTVAPLCGAKIDNSHHTTVTSWSYEWYFSPRVEHSSRENACFVYLYTMCIHLGAKYDQRLRIIEIFRNVLLQVNETRCFEYFFSFLFSRKFKTLSKIEI